MHVVSDESGYLGDKVLITWVVRGDDGEDVPVVLLHDVQHDGSLLLDGGAELKEHGVVILEMTEREAGRKWLCNIIDTDFNLVAFTHRGEELLLKGQQWFCNIIGANINFTAFILSLTEEKGERGHQRLVMIPVMIFISFLYDSFNEFVHTGLAAANSGDSKLLSLISSIIFIHLFYYSRVRTVQFQCYLLSR